MNLLYAEVIETMPEGASTMARVRVGGAIKRVWLDLVADVRPGEWVLVCDGIVLSKVNEETQAEI